MVVIGHLALFRLGGVIRFVMKTTSFKSICEICMNAVLIFFKEYLFPYLREANDQLLLETACIKHNWVRLTTIGGAWALLLLLLSLVILLFWVLCVFIYAVFIEPMLPWILSIKTWSIVFVVGYALYSLGDILMSRSR